jgi:Predicted nucleic acid-binding protein, contains PIN domain
MIVVLDASAAIEIALQKESAKFFQDILLNSDLVIAPDTFPSEITNVFWKYGFYSDMDKEKCEKGIDYCLDLIDDYIDTKSICREVFFESMNNEHSSYDIFYLVVARRHNAGIITKDKKMIATAKKFKIKVLGI